jgi:acetoin utilization deacetylase AcuC-like enzyme
MKYKTGFLYHPFFLRHYTNKDHPEHPDRLKYLYRYIANSHLVKENKITMLKARPKENLDYILLTHSEHYINLFKEYCNKNNKIFGHYDNVICKRSYDVALFHAYSSIYAADLIMNNNFTSIFIAGRPPSHHAGRDYALGFCFINSIAVVANYLISKWGLNKILIIDVDVHHGNGTQEIFYTSNKVFYFSIHEHPSFLFPGTGRFFEKGIKDGLNYTLNCPVIPNIRDSEYIKVFKSNCEKILSFFKPEIILVSAGYDTHENDDISHVELSTDCITEIFSLINNYAIQHCNGKLLLFLEGGYNINSLCECVFNTLEVISKGG